MLGFFLITLYFLLGFFVIRKIFPVTWYEALCLSPLPIFLVIICIGTPLYFLYKLDSLVIFILLCSPFLFWLPFLWKEIKNLKFNNFHLPTGKLATTAFGGASWQTTFTTLFLITSYFALIGLLFVLLFKFQTTNSVLGPWILIREPFLFLYGCAVFVLTLSVLKKLPQALQFVCIIIIYALSFFVTLILFPLGFGYDPFLHQATQQHILEYGLITPKTFYYLGQYILIVILSKISSLSIPLIDSFFLPLTASLAIPAACSFFLRTIPKASNTFIGLALISLLSIPFSYATLTTPWGFAMVGTILLSIFSILQMSLKSKISITFLALLSISILFVHPLAGIIAIGFLFITLFIFSTRPILKKYPRIKNGIVPLFLVLFSLFEALAFIINSKISGQLIVSFKYPTFENISYIFSFLLPTWTTQYHLFYDTAYLVKNNGALIFLVCAIGGTIFCIRKKILTPHNSLLPWYGFFLSIASALPLILFLNFPSLVWYERTNYITRFFELAPLFLVPVLLIFFNYAWNRIIHTSHALFIILVILINTGLVTSSLYLSYPHSDPFTIYHGTNLSGTDIKTVHWIHDDMKSRQCIVLANQMVSVAAIREFGFTGYRDITIQGKKQNLFYYPIPTGSPLHSYFLKMIQSPSHELMQKAMNEFGVSCGYFVVNSYENRFTSIVTRAQGTTDTWVSIDNGKNVVYAYSR